jgi:hypothetical protein
VVRSRKAKRAKETTTTGETRREKRTTVMPAKSIGAPGPSSIKTVARKIPGQATRTATLPRIPRASAVTVTLSEGARMSYAEVLAQAREKISLKELEVEKVEMRKAVTGAIIISVPGDKGRDKASKLATKLAGILDPSAVRIAAPLRTAELRLRGLTYPSTRKNCVTPWPLQQAVKRKNCKWVK